MTGYNDPAQQQRVAELNRELERLKREFKDEDRFADRQPKDEV